MFEMLMWVYDGGKGELTANGLANAVIRGWITEEQKQAIINADGVMLKGLQDIDGKWYYLDKEGEMSMEPVTLTPDQDGVLQYPGLVK